MKRRLIGVSVFIVALVLLTFAGSDALPVYPYCTSEPCSCGKCDDPWVPNCPSGDQCGVNCPLTQPQKLAVLSTFMNVVATPDGSIPTRFDISDDLGPVAGTQVELRYTALAQANGCWCGGVVPTSYTETTDSFGSVTFNITGGGCLDPDALGGRVIEVFIGGELVRDLGQVSPDVISTLNSPCTVGLSDAVNFTSPLQTAVYGWCYDLNSDCAVSLTDAVLLTPSVSLGTSCP